MFKVRASTKIFMGFAAFCGISWLGYNKIQDWMILGQHFAPIAPKRVDIVGVTPFGYRIIVANEVAQLVETQGDFEASQSDSDESSDSGGSVKKKISIKDMLGSLEGNTASLGAFVSSLNDLSENDLPPVRVIWTKPQLQKALAGDPVLSKKLEADMNVRLDGSPLPTLNINSIENGIVLQVPVPVNVNIAGQVKKIVANILVAYKPRLVKAVEADVAQQQQGKIDATTITGYYAQEAKKALGAKSKENIRQYLTDAMSDAQARTYADYPERILKTAFVVVNSDFIDDASYSTYASPNGKPLYKLNISLNDEGRRRLWQYTRNRVGDQILLTSDGVGIADARIQQPLMGGNVTITNMTDHNLLDDFIANLKSAKGEKVVRQ
jgi:hypothetical protein